MNRIRLLLTGTVAAGVLAFAAGAMATSISHYRAGTNTHPPSLTLTVYSNTGGSTVSHVSYTIKETCGPHHKSHFISEGALLGAKIDRHGHFSKTVHLIGATFSGTVSGNHATVTVDQSATYAQYGNCHGKHTFNATKS